MAKSPSDSVIINVANKKEFKLVAPNKFYEVEGRVCVADVYEDEDGNQILFVDRWVEVSKI